MDTKHLNLKIPKPLFDKFEAVSQKLLEARRPPTMYEWVKNHEAGRQLYHEIVHQRKYARLTDYERTKLTKETYKKSTGAGQLGRPNINACRIEVLTKALDLYLAAFPEKSTPI